MTGEVEQDEDRRNTWRQMLRSNSTLARQEKPQWKAAVKGRIHYSRLGKYLDWSVIGGEVAFY